VLRLPGETPRRWFVRSGFPLHAPVVDRAHEEDGDIRALVFRITFTIAYIEELGLLLRGRGRTNGIRR
jgi:hypothetical protein